MTDKEFKALRQSETNNSDYEFRGNKSPKCPHCGKYCDISEYEWYDLYEEGEHEKECPSCDREFSISTHVKYTFNTDEQEY